MGGKTGKRTRPGKGIFIDEDYEAVIKHTHAELLRAVRICSLSFYLYPPVCVSASLCKVFSERSRLDLDLPPVTVVTLLQALLGLANVLLAAAGASNL